MSPVEPFSFSCRKALSQTGAIFVAWQQHMRQKGRNNHVASQHLQQIRQGLLQTVLFSWHQHAAKQHRYDSKIQRCRELHTRSLVQTGFQAFVESAQLREAQEHIVQQSADKVKVSVI